jgi:putative pre-16S rRNA nuclease
MGRLLALDYGLKRTGIAVSDPMKIIATALETVESGNLIKWLKSYFSKEEVDEVIVGMPKNLDNSNTDATFLVKNILKELKLTFPEKSIQTVDERYTSKIAAGSMILSGKKKKFRQKKENLDMISATLILQSYMQQQP